MSGCGCGGSCGCGGACGGASAGPSAALRSTGTMLGHVALRGDRASAYGTGDLVSRAREAHQRRQGVVVSSAFRAASVTRPPARTEPRLSLLARARMLPTTRAKAPTLAESVALGLEYSRRAGRLPVDRTAEREAESARVARAFGVTAKRAVGVATQWGRGGATPVRGRGAAEAGVRALSRHDGLADAPVAMAALRRSDGEFRGTAPPVAAAGLVTPWAAGARTKVVPRASELAVAALPRPVRPLSCEGDYNACTEDCALLELKDHEYLKCKSCCQARNYVCTGAFEDGCGHPDVEPKCCVYDLGDCLGKGCCKEGDTEKPCRGETAFMEPEPGFGWRILAKPDVVVLDPGYADRLDAGSYYDDCMRKAEEGCRAGAKNAVAYRACMAGMRLECARLTDDCFVDEDTGQCRSMQGRCTRSGGYCPKPPAPCHCVRG